MKMNMAQKFLLIVGGALAGSSGVYRTLPLLRKLS